MSKKPKYKTLDMVLFMTNNDPIGFAQRSIGAFVGHAATIYDNVLDQYGEFRIRVLEETSEGLRMNIYDPEDMRICIRRGNIPFDETIAKQTIMNYWREKRETKNDGYDYVNLANAAGNEIMEVITFGVWEKHNILPSADMDICSESYGRLYNEVVKQEVFKEVQVFSPTDGYKTKQFKTIKEFDFEGMKRIGFF